ncbi:MAG: 3-methyl-2-oxobutanoate hydroxymethyltransferase [Micrococcales bacterium]
MAKSKRITALAEYKAAGTKFACLTSYDQQTAAIFDEAGVDVLLVGDSAADNALGYSTTLPITVDEIIPFGRAVAGAAQNSLVVVDMPFGSYEVSPQHAVENAVRIMKATGAAAVKLEGGVRSAAAIEAIVEAGIPVMGHIGFTPQSVHALGGFKVQGRGNSADALTEDALAVQQAGAFAVVLELVPADLATSITTLLAIPTIGIGAGNGTDGQILVWTDFAGLAAGKPRKFVRAYADLRGALLNAATNYVADVRSANFPNENESFEG